MKKNKKLYLFFYLIFIFVFVFLIMAETTFAYVSCCKCTNNDGTKYLGPNDLDSCVAETGNSTVASCNFSEAEGVPEYEAQAQAECDAWASSSEDSCSITNLFSCNLPNAIATIYDFTIKLGIALAFLMVMYGGIKWMMAGGSSERVGDAKTQITAAIIGLVLLLTSAIILETVNPRLLSLELPTLPSISAPSDDADIEENEEEGEEEQEYSYCTCLESGFSPLDSDLFRIETGCTVSCEGVCWCKD